MVIGKDRALMIDASALSKDHQEYVTTVPKALTDKSLSVIPTHLHFDHTGGLKYFDDIWVLDSKALAEFKQADGSYKIPVDAKCSIGTLGFIDNFEVAPFKPSRVVQDGEILDLGGGVTLKVIAMAGHTPADTMFFYQDANILFTGDFLCASFLIGGNDHLYASSTEKILKIVNKDTLLCTAHALEHITAIPVLHTSDFVDLKAFWANSTVAN